MSESDPNCEKNCLNMLHFLKIIADQADVPVGMLDVELIKDEEVEIKMLDLVLAILFHPQNA